MIRLILVISIALSSISVTEVSATPGTVRANGCHKSHCHSASELRTAPSGRKYVAGRFFTHKKKKRR